MTLFCVCLLSSSAIAQTNPFDFLFDGIDARIDKSAFLAAPREITRPLKRCQKMISKGEWNDAVAILGELLSDETIEDYLIPYSSRRFGSLRSRTETILGTIGTINTQYLESYRLRYEIRARRMLDAGIEADDLKVLKRVSSRFFFTDAGGDATMLLGHLELSKGHPSAAQSHFEKVLRFRFVAERFDPEVSILLATCQMLGGNRDAATETLLALKRRDPNSAVTILDKNYPIFSEDKDAINWLTSLIGDSPLSTNKAISQWLMFQGNPARTGKTGAGFPLLVPRWEQRLATSIGEQQEIDAYLKEVVESSKSPAPAFQPLVVGDSIVLRDATQIHGVDFETGVRKWTYPPKFAWNQKSDETELSSPQRERLRQRMLQDSVYGQSSSDGKLVFTIPSPGSTGSGYSSQFRNVLKSDPLDVRVSNELVAIDGANSGALKWRVGGATGLDEPLLEKAFFLGEALPLEGVLYCVCTQEDIVKLVALDTQTGKLRWEQQLATLDPNAMAKDPLRRLAGVSPSSADGKIICLTGTGAIVAVDLATRSLVWGVEFRKPDRKTDLVADENSYADALSDAWRDSQVTINSGMVFVTLISSRELICLNADDGTEVWIEEEGFSPKKVNRDGAIYLAGINNGKAILVGNRIVRAIDIFSGSTVWTTELKNYGVPSGRGYIGDDSLYLPTSSRRLLRLELDRGAIVDAIVTGRMLGNLVRFRGDVISHGTDHVCSFPELNAEEQRLSQIENQQLDDDAISTQAQILIQRGQAKEGVALLESLIQESPKMEYARILKACFDSLQRTDPEAAMQVLDMLQSTWPDADFAELERQRTFIMLSSGKYLSAANRILEQIQSETLPQKATVPLDTEIPVPPPISIRCNRMDKLQRSSAEPVFEYSNFSINRDATDNQWLRYSQEAWRKSQLTIAYRGLLRDQPSFATRLTDRIHDIVTTNLSGSETRVNDLLKNFSPELLSVETKIAIASWKLEQRQYLSALLCVNEALSSSDLDANLYAAKKTELQLLRAKICLAGHDLELAQTTLQSLGSHADVDSLLPETRSQIDDLNEQLRQAFERRSSEKAFGIESVSSRDFSDDIDSISTADSIVPTVAEIRTTELTEKVYRIPIEFETVSRPELNRVSLCILPWSAKGARFEIRDELGGLARELKLKMPSGADYGSQPFPKMIARQNLIQFIVQDAAVVIDWFKVLAGQQAVIWQMPYSYATGKTTAYDGGYQLFIDHGNELKCLDAITGETNWSRTTRNGNSRLTLFRGRLVSWSKLAKQLDVYDAETGQLIRSMKLDRFDVLRQQDGYFVAWHPLQPSEIAQQSDDSPATHEANATQSKGVNRYIGFEAATGNVAWTRDISDDMKRCFFENEICFASPDGSVEFIDFKTGVPVRSFNMDMSTVANQTLNRVDVHRHRLGLVVQLSCGKRVENFYRGKTRYVLNQISNAAANGPTMLIDAETGQPIWSRPATIENMGYFLGQPYDSNCLFFGRKVRRISSDADAGHYTQFAMIDAKTGRLIGNELVRTDNTAYGGMMFQWTQGSVSATTSNLTVQTTTHQAKVTLVRDAESPPRPIANLPYNAIHGLDDRIFSSSVSQLADAGAEELKRRAKQAAAIAKEKSENAKAQLKREMGIERP